jgi:glycosyltransferase involved in cell wall biosynthesis
MTVEDSLVTKTRLAVVLSHPTQYYSPWFQWLRSNTSLKFRVFYLWDFGVTEQNDPEFGTNVKWDVDLLSGYDSEFIPNRAKNPGAESFWGFNNPDLTCRLALWMPDAILLFGYKWLSHLRCVAWARMHGIPILFRGDSNLIGRTSPPFQMRVPLRALFAQFSSFLYVGRANRDYFVTFGVPERKLFFAPHSVNAAFFNSGKADYRNEARRLRLELGIDEGTKVMLFAGKLVAGKQPMELLSAFLRIHLPDTALVFVGEGPEKESLVRFSSASSGSPNRAAVHFLPFANQSEMPSRYLMADIFVLPSRGETWGLAVNEAMHMGIPCVVSEEVGCQRDLVADGETGWVFKSNGSTALEDTLTRALEDVGASARRQEIRRNVERRILGYTYAQTTSGLLNALAALTRQS